MFASVWVVKTHFPERYGWKDFAAQRVILLVVRALPTQHHQSSETLATYLRVVSQRNPVNAIRSYFNMLLTGTHTHSIAPSEYARFVDVWERHVRDEVGFWLRCVLQAPIHRNAALQLRSGFTPPCTTLLSLQLPPLLARAVAASDRSPLRGPEQRKRWVGGVSVESTEQCVAQ